MEYNEYLRMKKIKDKLECQSKITTEENSKKIKCPCSCKIPLRQFNHKGWTVCKWCGRRIELPNVKFKNEMKERLGL